MSNIFFYTYVLASPFLAGGLARSLQKDFVMYDPDAILGWTFIALFMLPVLIVLFWKAGEAIMNGFNQAMHNYQTKNIRVARLAASSDNHSDQPITSGTRTRRNRMSGEQIKQRVTRI